MGKIIDRVRERNKAAEVARSNRHKLEQFERDAFSDIPLPPDWPAYPWDWGVPIRLDQDEPPAKADPITWIRGWFT